MHLTWSYRSSDGGTSGVFLLVQVLSVELINEAKLGEGRTRRHADWTYPERVVPTDGFVESDILRCQG